MSLVTKNTTDYNHEAGMTFEQRKELFEKERREWATLMRAYENMRDNKWRFDRGLPLHHGDETETYEKEYEKLIFNFRKQTKTVEKL